VLIVSGRTAQIAAWTAKNAVGLITAVSHLFARLGAARFKFLNLTSLELSSLTTRALLWEDQEKLLIPAQQFIVETHSFVLQAFMLAS
jgi:hypothetical protein